MTIEVNKEAQFTVNALSNLNVNSITLSQKLERFDMYLHSGDLMDIPMIGNEIFNAE